MQCNTRKFSKQDEQNAPFLGQCKKVVDAFEKKDDEAVLIGLAELFEQVNDSLSFVCRNQHLLQGYHCSVSMKISRIARLVKAIT